MGVSDTTAASFPYKYGLAYTYDLNGRRTSLTHPADIDVGSGQVAYTYDTIFGQLATVTDPFSKVHRQHYDVLGRLYSLVRVSGVADSIIESRSYDAASRIGRRIVSKVGTTFRNDTLTYDARGKALSNGSGHTADYAPLGHLKAAGVGGGSESFVQDGHAYVSGGIRAGSQSYANDYTSGTGQLLRTRTTVAAGIVDTTHFTYSGMGATGTREVRTWLSGSYPNVQNLGRYETMSYTSDNKLKAVMVEVDSQPRPLDPSYKIYKYEETYRYDALGRRLETRLWRTSNCAAKDLDSGCRNTLTRTIWDGAQLLFELRWAGLDTIPNGWTSGTAPSNGDYTGTVGYVYGDGQTGEIDHPLALFKDTLLVLPHVNWRGMIDQGTCPTSLCPSNNPRFPGVAASAFGMTPVADDKWFGTVIAGMKDGSGLLYRRNRYVDPVSGRFTQEDPIGLAGGMNLYGFANGDPVNLSDPFGLCPLCVVAYAAFEVASVAYDLYVTQKAFRRSSAEGAAALNAAVMGAIAPGPGNLYRKAAQYFDEVAEGWGRNRIVKELHDRGFILDRPTKSSGRLLYRNADTGEEVRIMPRPTQRFRNDPPAKHESDYYYRYRRGPDEPWGPHTSIPNK